ncbi:hypothetical protein POJ06DRAFT_297616 [Lipomyces tetrasporus]|uniref:Short-chain dehydrogenases/reductase n=1 Tax=Lipomyces tetrasporus TaxID=54092 RepID=A0AAD7QK85_9ASCO|nr:uncharacterized protein POJ06DRAFT_297616 [Lipomyces tetrasporus]KAJ8096603.1 hypothetical protein POJ06DRAFT_297616 [Lipomyces tetrasporus]
MVQLSTVKSSNALIASSLPPKLVAVFVGATSGIGETSLKQFAKHACQPRIYFVGRSQQAGDRIAKECKSLNPEGEYIFVKADVSLLNNVDEVCEDLKKKESHINVLFQSQGTLDLTSETSENLNLLLALSYYSRMRFIINLLPLVRQASSLRRVVTVMAGTKEGPIDPNDVAGKKVGRLSARGHLCSMMTLCMETIAETVPEVSFIHNYPGAVDTPLWTMKGVLKVIVRGVLAALGPFIFVDIVETGERHLFLATSSKYPSKKSEDMLNGVPLVDGIGTARGTDGQTGSGVYTVDSTGESGNRKVQKLLAGLREKGIKEKVWQHTQSEFKRITGNERS